MKEKKMTQEEFYTVHQPSFLVVFLANKNKINSLLNVLNVIFFFLQKTLFLPPTLQNSQKKRLRKWLIPCPSTGPKLFLTGLNSFRIRPKSVSTNPKMSFQY